MPIFAVGSPGYQTTSVGSAAVARVWSGTNTALLASIYSSTNLGPQLRDITLYNSGTATCYFGQSGVTAALGQPLLAGQQLTIQNWTANAGTTTTDLFAICSNTGGTTTVNAALASNAWVV